MSTLSLRAAALAAAFVSLTAALLPLPAGAQQAATPHWSTYLGGAHIDRISAVTQLDGNVVTVGSTSSAGLGPNETTGQRANSDIFVARFEGLDGSLNSDFPLRVFGGTDGIDEPLAVAIGPGSSLYIVGQSGSTSFPGGTLVHYPPQPGTLTNAFLARISPIGGLDWIMFLNGNQDEAATGVAVVGTKVYVSGWTTSSNFMGKTVPAGTRGFVTEIDTSTVTPSIGWSAQPVLIEGNGLDMLHGLTLGANGKLNVVGTTTSTAFTAYGSKVLNTHKGGSSDAIVAQLDAASGTLDWLTFVGGGGDDQGNAITRGSGSQPLVVMAGTTNSPDNLGSGAPLSQTNAFVAWLRPDGQLRLSEVRQGSGNDMALTVTTDSTGNAYIGGKTASGDFEGVSTSGFDSMFDTGTGFREGFVWMAPPEGGQGWASFVGGNGVDEVTSLSLRDSNRLVMGLQTGSSAQLPGSPGAPPSYDGNLNGSMDGYLLSVGVADLSPPSQGTVNDRPTVDNIDVDIATTTSTSSLFANWSGFSDINTAIAKYEWALGTRANPSALFPFTSVDLNTSAGAFGLNLTVGEEYIVTVRATNTYGLTAVDSSNGVQVITPDTTVPDGGTDTPDSGTDTPDSGTGNPDGGPNRPDAGTDGGTTGPGDGGGGGDGPDSDPSSPIGWDVGCASGGGAAPLFLSLLALVLLGRRLRAR